MEETHNSSRQYVSVAVQTTPVEHFAACATGGTGCPSHLVASSYLQRDLTCESQASFDALRQTPLVQPQTASALAKGKLYLPRLVPNRNSTHLMVQQSRTVSLTERLASEHSLEKRSRDLPTSQRSVSLPTSYLQFLSPLAIRGQEMAMHPSSSFSNDDVEYSRVHVSADSPDLPQTPSPPSTPDSVEIIDNSVHFPESFLRHGTKEAKEANDDGWVSWASSPPRPIPALHGPASLPYARCPSGAEGTIIEENTNVPGLIWGLGDDANHHSRTHTTSTQPPFPTLLRTQHAAQDRRQYSNMFTFASGKSAQQHMKTHSRNSGSDDSSMDPPHQREPLPIVDNRYNYNNPSSVPKPDSGAVIRLNNQQHGMDMNTRSINLFNANTNYVQTLGTISRPEFNTETPSAYLQLPVGGHSQEPKPKLGNEHQNAVTSSKPNLNAEARSFIPTKTLQSSVPSQTQDNFTDERTLAVLRLQTEIQLAKLQAQLAAYQSMFGHPEGDESSLMTPPDSSSSLWSAQLTPLDRGSKRGSVCKDPSSPSTKQSNLVNLDNVSSELRNFPLGHNIVSGHDCETSDDSCPPTPLDVSYALPQVQASAPRLSRPFRDPSLPEMPIHLENLVPRYTSKISSVMTSPGPHTSVLFTSFNAGGVALRNSSSTGDKQSYPSPTSPMDEEAGRRKPAFGRRLPRSIPLARLVNRRLASVPEESSVMNCDESKDISSRSFDEVSTRKSRLERSREHSPTDTSEDDSSILINSSQSSIEEERSVLITPRDIKVKLPAGNKNVPKNGKATSKTEPDIKAAVGKWRNRKGSLVPSGPAGKTAGKWRRKEN